MSIKNIQAIDVHAHFGTFLRGKSKLIDQFMSGDAEKVINRAKTANTKITIVSPLKALIPRLNNDPITANEEEVKVVGQTPGLRQWVVVDPLKPQTFDQADRMLHLSKCVGIKIHPEEHGYSIVKHGRTIFEFAAKHQTVVLSHSGEKNSMPVDLVKCADDFPEMKLILAHLGNGGPDLHVRAIQNSRKGNVFVDTSSAAGLTSGLLEWAVKEIGAERIVYGTDSPLYFAPMQRARIDYAEISDNDKKLILCDNATKLFHFKTGEI